MCITPPYTCFLFFIPHIHTFIPLPFIHHSIHSHSFIHSFPFAHAFAFCFCGGPRSLSLSLPPSLGGWATSPFLIPPSLPPLFFYTNSFYLQACFNSLFICLLHMWSHAVMHHACLGISSGWVGAGWQWWWQVTFLHTIYHLPPLSLSLPFQSNQ